MHAGVGFRFEQGLERTVVLAQILYVHRSTGVCYVHAGGAIALNQFGLRGLNHMAYRQETDGVHAYALSTGEAVGG